MKGEIEEVWSSHMKSSVDSISQHQQFQIDPVLAKLTNLKGSDEFQPLLIGVTGFIFSIGPAQKE